MQLRVIYKRLPAKDIFNACDPGQLWNVASEYKEEWWDSKYDSLRNLLRDVFIAQFDCLTGHYTSLEASILQNGIRDPIVITAGPPLWREHWQIKGSPKYICESLGGSRLLIAQQHDLDVPCIINDQIDTDGVHLKTESQVQALVGPRFGVHYGPPCRLTVNSYSHMPSSYTFEEQQRCRRQIKQRQLEAWKIWKEQNMSASGI